MKSWRRRADLAGASEDPLRSADVLRPEGSELDRGGGHGGRRKSGQMEGPETGGNLVGARIGRILLAGSNQKTLVNWS